MKQILTKKREHQAVAVAVKHAAESAEVARPAFLAYFRVNCCPCNRNT